MLSAVYGVLNLEVFGFFLTPLTFPLVCSSGDLQSFGALVVHVADQLADRTPRDPRAALRLGYLIGAAERGASHSEGIHAELVHRLQATARRVPPGASATLERGRRAGERRG